MCIGSAKILSSSSGAHQVCWICVMSACVLHGWGWSSHWVPHRALKRTAGHIRNWIREEKKRTLKYCWASSNCWDMIVRLITEILLMTLKRVALGDYRHIRLIGQCLKEYGRRGLGVRKYTLLLLDLWWRRAQNLLQMSV